MTLSFVKPPEQPWINVLLYGPPKTGKTTGACSVPGGVLLMNADLANAAWFAHSQDPEGRISELDMTSPLQALIDVTNAIAEQPATEARMVNTVVLDPVGELHRRMLEEASNRAIRPTLNQYGDTSTYIERFCRMLCDAPINAVFVCHEQPVKDEASGGFERLPYTGTTNPALGQKLMGMVDVVGYTGVIETANGKEYVAQVINAQGRRGGDRFDVLDVGDGYRRLNLTEWFAAIHGAQTVEARTEKQIEREQDDLNRRQGK